MTTILTNLRNTLDEAKRIRFEPSPPFTATNVQDAVAQALSITSSIPTHVSTSPYVPASTDTVLLVDTSLGPVTINMPASAARLGMDVTIKDATGNAVANPISVVRNGAEVIDGLTTYTIDSNFGAATFSPQAGGYFVKP